MNLLDQDYNNLYTYQSKLGSIGSKRFHLDSEDNTLFLQVISTSLNQEVLAKNVFDDHEIHHVLSLMENRMLRMKNPDLEYIIMIDFERMKYQDFWDSQELLLG